MYFRTAKIVPGVLFPTFVILYAILFILAGRYLSKI